MRRLLSLSLWLCLACGPTAPAPRSAAPAPAADPLELAPPPRADGRLPGGVVPTAYALEFTIDPKQPRFMGRARISIRIEHPTRSIVLHGRDLSILTASVASPSGKQWAKSKLRPAAGSKGEAEELVLVTPKPLAPGAGEIDIQYDAPFADGLAGLYRVEEGGRAHAFTQFEPTDARRAFPSFDEPSFKVPFELSLTTPKQLTAIANMPLVERSEQRESGLATHRFERSPPLPTYLVAFAVGELDVVEGPKQPIPIRAVTTRGKSGLVELALKSAEQQLGLLADYFGEPYPYAKLDLVAVPDFAAGAMENPGLVTFREELLLLDPKSASSAARRGLSAVMAHELAHQWFGNLVTLSWWDEVWLNEGFASWMGTKILDRQSPELGAGLDALSAKARVMGLDALPSARKVRQPVTSSSQALEAFDAITYTKGMSILGMTESWLGADRFQKGVHGYVAAHRHGSATARDLFEALERATGQSVAPVMDSFLDQTGVPVVETAVDCTQRQLTLSQREYRPLGVAEASAPKRWRFPVCVRYRNDQWRRACVLLTAERGTIALEGKGCPTLVVPNAADRGYYHYALPAAELGALARAKNALDPAERAGLVSGAFALVKSGELGADEYLGLLAAFRAERSRVVLERMVATLDELERIVPDQELGAFHKFVTELLSPAAKRLGFEPKPGDSDDTRLLRKSLLAALGRLGDDPWVRTNASRVAARWRHEPEAVDADIAAVAVAIDAERGDEELFEALRERMLRPKTPEQRMIALAGLAGLSKPELVNKVLALVLDRQAFKAQDVRYLIPPLFSRRATRPAAWAFTKENYAALEKRLPPFVFGRMAWVVSYFCDDAQTEQAARFFESRLGKVEGADKPMRQAVEAGKLCAALARGQRARLSRALGARP